jgi:DNA-binding transcriptional regulator YhcF (GntR family)
MIIETSSIQKSATKPRSKPAAGKEPAVNEVIEELAIKLRSTSSFPLYRQVADHIMEFIETGRLKPGCQLVSERNMAEILHISRRTVRAAFGELIAKQYLSATHGCGNFVLTPPRKREIWILALERFRKEHTGMAPRHHDLIHEAEKRHHLQVHYKYVPDLENFQDVLQAPPGGYHGILLYRPPQEWMDLLTQKNSAFLSEIPIPLLVSSREMPGSAYHYVSPDHSWQTRTATERLVQMGHRRIGYVSGFLNLGHMQAAYQGYQRAIEDAGLSRYDKDQLLLDSVAFPQSEEHIQRFLAKRRFTAVVVAGSGFSASFENAAQRAAIHIPGELSAILVTEKNVLERLALRWTSILYPDEVVGRSLEILAAAAKDPSGPLFQELIPFHEVAGATCKNV